MNGGHGNRADQVACEIRASLETSEPHRDLVLALPSELA